MSRSGSNEQDANFLGRWARRKAQAKSNKAPDATPTVPAPEEPTQAQRESLAPTSQSEPAAAAVPDDNPPAPIPPLESLDENSDYSRFMASDVEKDLRRLALRKLFKAPAFGIRDGLDDYDDDFTSFEKLGNIVTADMKFHKERLEAEAAKAQEEQEQRLLAQRDESDRPIDQEAAANNESDTESDTESGADADIGTDVEAAESLSDQSDQRHLRHELAGSAIEPGLVILPQPRQRLPETAPPVLAPRRQGLRLRVDTPDDTQDA